MLSTLTMQAVIEHIALRRGLNLGASDLSLHLEQPGLRPLFIHSVGPHRISVAQEQDPNFDTYKRKTSSGTSGNGKTSDVHLESVEGEEAEPSGSDANAGEFRDGSNENGDSKGSEANREMEVVFFTGFGPWFPIAVRHRMPFRRHVIRLSENNTTVVSINDEAQVYLARLCERWARTLFKEKWIASETPVMSEQKPEA